MEITRTAKPSDTLRDMKLWHCRGCRVVHLSANGTLLNFTRDEFAAFAEVVADINYSGWSNGNAGVLDLLEHGTESYITAVVQ